MKERETLAKETAKEKLFSPSQFRFSQFSCSSTRYEFFSVSYAAFMSRLHKSFQFPTQLLFQTIDYFSLPVISWLPVLYPESFLDS